MSTVLNSPARNTGYITRYNSRGQAVVIPVGFARGLNALRHLANNCVEHGCYVDAANNGANPTLGVFSVTEGAVRQQGLVRRVAAIQYFTLPGSVRHVGYGTSPNKITVYVPPIATTDGTYIGTTGRFQFKLNSEFVVPTVAANVTTSGKNPVVPTGAVVLAHIYYNSAQPTTSGATIGRDVIDNNARPKLFEPVGIWYR